MLARGMDVKVASLQNSKDPADLILENPVQYKHAIGASKHVIEFLLSHLKQQAKDDRSYKLLVRDEVLPFVARMQNQIDREHFEHVIAAALQTTKDAIHIETNRIIENQAIKVRTEEKTFDVESTAEVQKELPKSTDALEAYVVAAQSVVLPPLKNIIERAFYSVTGQPIEEKSSAISAATISPIVFTLEATFANLSEHEIKVDLANRLELLRVATLRQRLNETKLKLHIAEQHNDSATIETLLTKANELNKKLAATPITILDLE